MATTAEASAPDGAPIAVGFAPTPAAFRVQPAEVLRWAVAALLIANLGRIPVLSTGQRDAAMVLNDLCVIAVVSLGLVAALLRRSLLIDAPAAFALAFAAVGLGSAFYAVPRFDLSPGDLFVSLSYLVRWLTYFGIYVFVVNNVGDAHVPRIWKALLTVMLVFTAFGAFQSAFLPGFAQIVYPDSREYTDWDPQGHRLVSTVLEPNIAAAMIVIVLLVQLAQISVGARVPYWQPGLFLLGLALTLSRSGVLALLAGLVVIVFVRGLSLRLMRMFAVIMVLSIAVIPRLLAFAQAYAKFDVGEGTSAGTRIIAWILAIDTIAKHPWVGVGFNTYGYVKESLGIPRVGVASYGSDGGLLFAMVMTGAVGLALYIGMLWAVIRRCRTIWRNPAIYPERRGLAIGAAASVVAVCVHSLFVNSMFTTFVMEMLWILWGLTFAIARERGAVRVVAN